jgi:hypothetical protein
LGDGGKEWCFCLLNPNCAKEETLARNLKKLVTKLQQKFLLSRLQPLALVEIA